MTVVTVVTVVRVQAATPTVPHPLMLACGEVGVTRVGSGMKTSSPRGVRRSCSRLVPHPSLGSILLKVSLLKKKKETYLKSAGGNIKGRTCCHGTRGC